MYAAQHCRSNPLFYNSWNNLRCKRWSQGLHADFHRCRAPDIREDLRRLECFAAELGHSLRLERDGRGKGQTTAIENVNTFLIISSVVTKQRRDLEDRVVSLFLLGGNVQPRPFFSSAARFSPHQFSMVHQTSCVLAKLCPEL